MTESKKDALPTFKSVAVIGAAGQTGELFAGTLSQVTSIEAVVRTSRWRDEASYPGIGFHESIAEMLQTEPEAIILATPNPTSAALKEIAKYAQKPLTLILSQNGVDLIDEETKKALVVSQNPITLVRASLFTNVSRDGEGDIVYNPNKNRIALASMSEDSGESLQKAENTFAQAGFEVRKVEDYRSMEWTKLLANLVGSTSTITGLTPKETFSDAELFKLEHRALKDRLRLLEEAGIPLAENLWGVGKLKLLAGVPGYIAACLPVRKVIAGMIAKERNNQPSAAARQISEGARKVESTHYYHHPVVQLGRDNRSDRDKKSGTPVDKAIWNVLERHQNTKYEFSLKPLSGDERKKLLLEIFGYETKQLFVTGKPLVKTILNKLYEHHTDSFTVIGKENLQSVADVLAQGQSVLIVPGHRSHADHETVIKALREELPEEAQKYPVYVVAGMKFDNEIISGTLGHAYSHPTVWTLGKNDSEDMEWRAKMVNNRAEKVIEGLLSEGPCIFVVYIEGGRSKITNEAGKLQLQAPAPGSSKWLTNSRFGIVLTAAIRGTEKMLTAGKQWPQHADISIQFGKPAKIGTYQEEAAALPREERDEFLSRRVLEEVALMLPPDERGSYGH